MSQGGDQQRSKPRPSVAVYHLGRSSDIAGGMSQVLRAYVSWNGWHVRVRVIETRGEPGSHIMSARMFVPAARAVARLPKSSSVVVAHLSEGGSFLREGALLLLARARGIATVSHLHGAHFAAFAEKHPRLVSTVLRASDQVIVLSSEAAAVASRFKRSESVVLIPNSLIEQQQSLKRKDVVFAGAVGWRKGADVLLSAWQTLSIQDDWRLVIAGPIHEDFALTVPVPGVTFLGPIPNDAVRALLSTAEIAVLPSRDEAMPMFLLEAMAAGCAIVSTTVGGIPQLLQNQAGVLVPPGDINALSNALQRLVERAEERADYQQAALSRFRAVYAPRNAFPSAEAAWLRALASRFPASVRELSAESTR